MDAMLLSVVPTPLSLDQAIAAAKRIYAESRIAAGAEPDEDTIVAGAQELVNLSNAMNWRGLVAQGLPIATIITILMSLLPVIVKNPVIVDFIKNLVNQILPFLPS